MPSAPSADKPSNQSKFTARTHRSLRSTSDSPLLVVKRDKVEAPKGATPSKSDEEESDGELEDGLFIVETIKKHLIDKNGNLVFQVKWKGFENKKDLTWEPEENLKVSGDEILNEYFDTIGGRHKIFEESNRAAKTKRRIPTTNGTFGTRLRRLRQNKVHVTDETLLATAKKWSPPSGSWEDEIETIDACEKDNDGYLIVYIIWKNGQKTKHGTEIVYKKCPQKMLQFYEEYVNITRKEEMLREMV
ncbi:related to chromatin-associated swi6 protein [Fusarium torulosum]|uniref:Related to chromatin-associated swi6 protein n=1 Tax=Fusarium torulosum TaxID=33205 RepID=A0AAE8MC37_9HYPO|nr:related to chromatin-associated swi6 protein [Fusarium torulosum]